MQSFATPQPVRLTVKVPAADVDVVTIDGGESTVTLAGPPKLVEIMKVELVRDRLIVAPHRKPFSKVFGRFDGSLHVLIHIPHRSSVEIVTAAGSATLDGTFAGLELSSTSGDVRVTGDLDGNATTKTVSGDVLLPRVVGDVTVRTVSGDLTAESVDGSVSVKSVSGDVHVQSLRGGAVTVRNVSGDIALGIAPGTNIDVDARTASGHLSSEVPLSAARGTEETGPTVVVRGNTVSGDLRVFRAA